MAKVKVLLNCVYGEHQPGEQVVVDEEFAKHYHDIGFMEILESVNETDAKKTSSVSVPGTEKETKQKTTRQKK